MEEEYTAPTRRSTRVRSQPERFGDIYADEQETKWRTKHGMSIQSLIKEGTNFVHGVNTVSVNSAGNIVDSDLPTYDEAMSSKDAPTWHLAMKAELANLKRRGTWAPSRLPRDRKLTGCK